MRYTIEDQAGSTIIATTAYQHNTTSYLLRDIEPMVSMGFLEDGDYIVNVYDNWDDPVAVLDIHVEDKTVEWRF